MSDFRRRLMNKKVEGELPYGYTRLNYLEGTGIQWLNLGFKLNNNYSVELNFSYANFDSVSGNIFGSRLSATLDNFSVTAVSGIIVDFYDFNVSRVYLSDNKYSNKIIQVTADKNSRQILCNGELLISNDNVIKDSFTTPDNAYLFNMSGNPYVKNKFKGKIFTCKIYKSGVLMQDLFPCLDKNNRPCMYDTVSQKPFYNQGTGEFLYG